MVVLDRQQVGLACLEPAACGTTLALRAMAVAAGSGVHSITCLWGIHLTGAGRILPAWRSQSQALTTLVPSASSRRGSSPTPTAWTTWSGCAGRPGSSARNAGTLADGGWEARGSCARTVTPGHP